MINLQGNQEIAREKIHKDAFLKIIQWQLFV